MDDIVDDAIGFIVLILFLAIFYWITSVIYSLITAILILVVILLLIGISSYYFYKWKQQFLPSKIGNVILQLCERLAEDKLSKSKGKGKGKTPMLSQNEKDRIIVNVAKGRCEYPNCRVESYLEIHHIIPRSEGGRNTHSNLIVLCPNHHSKADGGGISRSRLRYIIKQRK